MAIPKTKMFSYAKNVGKSISYSAIDAIKQSNPAIAGFVDTNKDVMKGAYNAIVHVDKMYTDLTTQLLESKYGEMGRDALKNVKEDLKSGKWYNLERTRGAESAAMEAAGWGDDEDFGFDGMSNNDDFFTDDDALDSDSLVDLVGQKSSQAVSEAIIQTTEQSINAQASIAKATAEHNQALYANIHAGMGTINENIGKLIEIANGPVTTHMENSKTYFESETKLSEERNSILKEILDIQKSIYKKEEKNAKNKITMYNIMDEHGMPDLELYFERILKNVNDNTGGMGDMIKDMLEGGVLETIIASPLQAISDTIAKQLIPKALDASMKQLNKSVSGLFASGMAKLMNSDSDSENPILNFIKNTFGISDATKVGINVGKYEKGAVPFDGITRKSIVEVIPTYLARIETALMSLSGVEAKEIMKLERRFDFDTGKFVNANDIRKNFRYMITSEKKRANNDISKYFDKFMNMIDFGDDKKRKKQLKKNFDILMDQSFQTGVLFNPNEIDKYALSDYNLTGEDAEEDLAFIRKIFETIPKDVMLNYANNVYSAKNSITKRMESLERSGHDITSSLFNDSFKSVRGKGRPKSRKKGGKKKSSSNKNTNQNNTARNTTSRTADRGSESSDDGDPDSPSNLSHEENALLAHQRKYEQYNRDKLIEKIDAKGKNITLEDAASYCLNGINYVEIDGEQINLNEFLDNCNGKSKNYKLGDYLKQRESSNATDTIVSSTNPDTLNQGKSNKVNRGKKGNITRKDATKSVQKGNTVVKIKGEQIDLEEFLNATTRESDTYTINEYLDAKEKKKNRKSPSTLSEGIRRLSGMDNDSDDEDEKIEKSVWDADDRESTALDVIDKLNQLEEKEKSKNKKKKSKIREKLDEAANSSSSLAKLVTNVEKLINKPTEFLAGIIKKADNAIYELIFGVEFDEHGERKSVAKAIFDGLKEQFDQFKEWMKKAFKPVRDWFNKEGTIGNKAKKFVQEQLGNLGESEFGREFKRFFHITEKEVKEAASSIKSTIREDLADDTDKLNKVDNLIDQINEKVKSDNKKDKDDSKKKKSGGKKKGKKKSDKIDGQGETEEIADNGNAAAGMRRVKKTGVIAVSAGEMVIPPDLNPANIRKREANENREKKKFANSLADRIKGFSSGGIVPWDMNDYEDMFDQMRYEDDDEYTNDIDRQIGEDAKVDKEITHWRAKKRKDIVDIWINKFKDNFDSAFSEFESLNKFDKETLLNAFSKKKHAKKLKRILEEENRKNMFSGRFKRAKDSIKDAWKRGKKLAKGDDEEDKEGETQSGYIQEIIKKALNTNGEMTDEQKKLVDEGMGDIKNHIPEAAGGAVIGAGISFLTGAVGGPLVGAAVGAGISLIKNSESLNKMLFGDKLTDENGNVIGRKGNGLLSEELTKNIHKYAPGVGKGAILGGISSLLPIVPFGPFTGILLGSAVGLAANNEKVRESLFGDEGLWKDGDKKIKKALPALGLGAAAGFVMGPFGAIPNIMLGSAAGFATTTDKFKDILFGEKDEDGKRHGGVIETAVHGLFKPIGDFTKNTINNLVDWADKNIKRPLKDAIQPIKKQFKLMFQGIHKGINSLFKEALGATFDDMLRDYIFKPVTGFIKKTTGMMLKPFKMIISSPFKLIGAVGNKLRDRQVQRGQADYMTADERNAWREQRGILRSNSALPWRRGEIKRFKNIDKALPNLGGKDAKNLAEQLSFALDSEKALEKSTKEAHDKFTKNVRKNKKLSAKQVNDIADKIKKYVHKEKGSPQKAAKAAHREIDNMDGLSDKDKAELKKSVDEYIGAVQDKYDRKKQFGNNIEAFKRVLLDMDAFKEAGVKNIENKDLPKLLDYLKTEAKAKTAAGEESGDKGEESSGVKDAITNASEAQDTRHKETLDILTSINENLEKLSKPNEDRVGYNADRLEGENGFTIPTARKVRQKTTKITGKVVKGTFKVGAAPIKGTAWAAGAARNSKIGKKVFGNKDVYFRDVNKLNDYMTEEEHNRARRKRGKDIPQAAGGGLFGSDTLAAVSKGEIVVSPNSIKNFAGGGIAGSGDDSPIDSIKVELDDISGTASDKLIKAFKGGETSDTLLARLAQSAANLTSSIPALGDAVQYLADDITDSALNKDMAEQGGTLKWLKNKVTRNRDNYDEDPAFGNAAAGKEITKSGLIAASKDEYIVSPDIDEEIENTLQNSIKNFAKGGKVPGEGEVDDNQDAKNFPSLFDKIREKASNAKNKVKYEFSNGRLFKFITDDEGEYILDKSDSETMNSMKEVKTEENERKNFLKSFMDIPKTFAGKMRDIFLGKEDAEDKKNKKGILGKIFSVFGGGKNAAKGLLGSAIGAVIGIPILTGMFKKFFGETTIGQTLKGGLDTLVQNLGLADNLGDLGEKVVGGIVGWLRGEDGAWGGGLPGLLKAGIEHWATGFEFICADVLPKAVEILVGALPGIFGGILAGIKTIFTTNLYNAIHGGPENKDLFQDDKNGSDKFDVTVGGITTKSSNHAMNWNGNTKGSSGSSTSSDWKSVLNGTSTTTSGKIHVDFSPVTSGMRLADVAKTNVSTEAAASVNSIYDEGIKNGTIKDYKNTESYKNLSEGMREKLNKQLEEMEKNGQNIVQINTGTAENPNYENKTIQELLAMDNITLGQGVDENGNPINLSGVDVLNNPNSLGESLGLDWQLTNEERQKIKESRGHAKNTTLVGKTASVAAKKFLRGNSKHTLFRTMGRGAAFIPFIGKTALAPSLYAADTVATNAGRLGARIMPDWATGGKKTAAKEAAKNPKTLKGKLMKKAKDKLLGKNAAKATGEAVEDSAESLWGSYFANAGNDELASQMANGADDVAGNANKSNGLVSKVKDKANKLKETATDKIKNSKVGTKATETMDKVKNKSSDLIDLTKKKASSLKNKVLGKTGEAAGEGLENAAKKAAGKETGGIVKQILETVTKNIKGLVKNNAVLECIGDALRKLGKKCSKEAVEEVVDIIVKKIEQKMLPKFAEKLAVAGTKAIGKVAAQVCSGGIFTVAFAAKAFYDGFVHCETVLGVVEDNSLVDYDPSFGTKLITGIVSMLNEIFLMGLLPLDMVFDFLYEGIKNIFGIDNKELTEARKKSEEVVKKYNMEHDENMTIEEYNAKDRWTTKLKKGAGDFFLGKVNKETGKREGGLAGAAKSGWNWISGKASDAWSWVTGKDKKKEEASGKAISMSGMSGAIADIANKATGNKSADANIAKTQLANSNFVNPIVTNYNNRKDTKNLSVDEIQQSNTPSKPGGILGVAQNAVSGIAEVGKSAVGKAWDIHKNITNVAGMAMDYATYKSDQKASDRVASTTEADNPLAPFSKFLAGAMDTVFAPLRGIFTLGKGVQKLVSGVMDFAGKFAKQVQNDAKRGKEDFDKGDLKSYFTLTHTEVDAEGNEVHNPLSPFRTFIKASTRILNFPALGLMWVGKQIGKGISKLINGAKTTIDLMAVVASKTVDIATNGSIKDYFNFSSQEGEGPTPFSWLNTTITGATRIAMLPIAAGISVGTKIKKGVTNLINGVKTVLDVAKDNADDSIRIAKEGSIKEYFDFTNNKSDKLPFGFMSTLITGATRIAMLPMAAGVSVGTKIKDGINSIIDGVKSFAVDNVKDQAYVTKYFKKDNLDGYWDSPVKKEGFAGVILSLMGKVNRVVQFVPITIAQVIGKIGDALSKPIDWVKEKIGGFADGVLEFFGMDGTDEEGKNSKGEVAALGEGGSGSGVLSKIHASGSKPLPDPKYKDDPSFVSQVDNKYAKTSFNVAGDTRKQTIADTGCGPAAAAMVVNNATNAETLNMRTAAKDALKYKVKDGGVNAAYFENEFSKHGISTNYILDNNKSVRNENILNSLYSGNRTVLMGNDSSNRSKSVSPYGPKDHYIVATRASKDGKYIWVNDPESRTPEVRYPASVILNNTKMGIAGVAASGSGLLGKVIHARGSGMSSINRQLQKIHASGKYGPDTVEYKVWNGLRAAGLDEIHVAAIMGNIRQECEFKPSAIEKGGGGGFGLVQWTGPRRTAIESYANSIGKSPSDLVGVQIPFLIAEMTPGGGCNGYATYQFMAQTYEGKRWEADSFQKATDLNTATRAFCWTFERCKEYHAHMDDVRIPAAKEYYEAFTGQPIDASISSGSISGGENSTSSSGGTILDKIFGVFGDFAKAFGLSSGDSSSSSSSTGIPGTVSEKQQALVEKMKSVEGQLDYSQNARNPDGGSGDCSSTVQWAYKNVLGPEADPGDWSGAYATSPNTYTVTEQLDPSVMQPGDAIVYNGHIEMYAGNGQMIGHGGPGKGPTVKPLSDKKGRFRMVRRWQGFKDLPVMDGMDSATTPDDATNTQDGTGETTADNSTKTASTGASLNPNAGVSASGTGLNPNKDVSISDTMVTSDDRYSDKRGFLRKSRYNKSLNKNVKIPASMYAAGSDIDNVDKFVVPVKRSTKKDNTNESINSYLKAILKLLAKEVENTSMLNTIITILKELIKVYEEERKLNGNSKDIQQKREALENKRESMLNILNATGIQGTGQSNDLAKLIKDAERLASI